MQWFTAAGIGDYPTEGEPAFGRAVKEVTTAAKKTANMKERDGLVLQTVAAREKILTVTETDPGSV